MGIIICLQMKMSDEKESLLSPIREESKTNET